MPCNIRFEAETEVVEITYAGVLTGAEPMEAAGRALSLARERHCQRFLGDCTLLEGGHPLGGLYGMATRVESEARRLGLREAIVLPASPGARTAEFWENTCLNRGIAVRAFHDRASALAWLRGPGSVSA